MKQKVTFLVFVGFVILVGVYFFRIVRPFLLPLLMAGTLALLVQPLFAKVVPWVGGHRRVAAMLVTVVVLLIVVLPVFIVLGFAAQELIQYGGEVVEEVQTSQHGEVAPLIARLKRKLTQQDYERLCVDLRQGQEVDAANFSRYDSETLDLIQRIRQFSPEEVERGVLAESGAAYLDPDAIPLLGTLDNWLSPYIQRSDLEDLRSSGLAMVRTLLGEVYDRTAGLISNVVAFLIGFAVMILAFYYFLAEGPAIADEIESLLPLEPEDEVAVAKQFETICRGVVWGTLAAAVAQAIVLGIALAILRIPAAWLLTCLAVVAAMIPFIGAGGVYVPVSFYLFWNERYAAGTFLLLYGVLLVSTIDNLVRAHMIHGTSRLHPLIALISALGALQMVGLWGIFVGPVVAGIFYAMLKILQKKLKRMDSGDRAMPKTP